MSNHVKSVLGILIFPNFETLDVFGPIQMFSKLPIDTIEILMISEKGGLIKSSQGQCILSDCSFENAPALSYLLIPGGQGTRLEVHNSNMVEWIKSQVHTTELIMTVCTGAALLAKTGALDGKRATTNKLAFKWVTEQGPLVQWIKQARWIDEGKL